MSRGVGLNAPTLSVVVAWWVYGSVTVAAVFIAVLVAIVLRRRR